MQIAHTVSVDAVMRDHVYHSAHTLLSSSERLCMLAATLSISPSKLRRYTMEVQRRGARETAQPNDADQTSTPRATMTTIAPHTTPISENHIEESSGAHARMRATRGNAVEETQEFPPLLHALLCVLVLPFTGGDNSVENANSTSAVTSTTHRVAVKGNESKRVSREKGVESKKTVMSESASPATSEAKTKRLGFSNMKEHFASLRENVSSRRADASTAQEMETPSGEEVEEKEERNSTSSISSSSSDGESEEVDPGISSTVKVQKREPKRKRHRYPRMAHSCLVGWGYDEVSLSELLAELAQSALTAKVQFIATGNHSTSETDSKLELQRSMQLLPRALHTSAGVSRIFVLYPPFLPLLLEALLKECLRGDAVGLAARRVVVRLTELAAPYFVAQHVRCTSRTSPCSNYLNDEHEERIESNDNNNYNYNTNSHDEEVFYQAMLLRATRRLSTAAVSLLQMIEDPVWALAICDSLISSQLLHPTSLVDVLHRRALDLAKTPQLWKPAVALAYSIVTYHRLRPCVLVATEEEEGEVYRGEKQITDLSTSDVIHATSEAQSFCVEGHSEGVDSARNFSLASELAGVFLSDSKSQSQQEQKQPSSVLPDALYSPRSRSVISFMEAVSGTVAGTTWTSVASMGRAASLSSLFKLPMEQQPCCISSLERGEASNLQWRFPEKVPSVVTMPNTIVMTCMILCAGPLGQHTVLTLCQWCLRALAISPSTSCAVGLTHLMMKYPQFLEKGSLRSPHVPQASSHSSYSATASSSVSGHPLKPFCGVVFSEGCRLAQAVVQQLTRLRNDGRLTLVWQTDGTPMDGEHGHQGNDINTCEETCSVREDPALRGLHELQCYLVMMLQSLVMRRGVQLSAEAQDELMTLFVSLTRLRIMVGTEIQKGNTWKGENVKELPRCEDTLPQLILTLVDDSFRAVARAIDVVLHDYDAGCPRQLCDALVLLLPPRSNLFVELRNVGAWEKHLDCLETIQAAAEAYKEAIHSVFERGPPGVHVKKEEKEEEEPRDMDTYFPNTIYQRKRLAHSPSLLSLQEELAAEAKRVVVDTASTRSGAEVMFGSLIGVLPCSGEPLRLSAANGGLTTAHKQWWLEHVMVYLVEEWWRSRTAVHVQFHPFVDGDGSEGSGLLSKRDQRGFLRVMPNSIVNSNNDGGDIIKEEIAQLRALLDEGGLQSGVLEGKYLNQVKRARQLGVQLESERTYSQKLERQLASLEEELRRVNSNKEGLGNLPSKGGGRGKKQGENSLEDTGEPQNVITTLKERLERAYVQLNESKLQLEEHKKEIQHLRKVLQQEVGGTPQELDTLIKNVSEGVSWRGRAQQIVVLKGRVKELERLLAAAEQNALNLHEEYNSAQQQGEATSVSPDAISVVTTTTTRKPLLTGRSRDLDDVARDRVVEVQYRRLQQQRELQEALDKRTAELEEQRKRVEAAQARYVNLESDNRTLREYLHTVLEKTENDNALIDAYREEMEQLRQALRAARVKLQEWEVWDGKAALGQHTVGEPQTSSGAGKRNTNRNRNNNNDDDDDDDTLNTNTAVALAGADAAIELNRLKIENLGLQSKLRYWESVAGGSSRDNNNNNNNNNDSNSNSSTPGVLNAQKTAAVNDDVALVLHWLHSVAPSAERDEIARGSTAVSSTVTSVEHLGEWPTRVADVLRHAHAAVRFLEQQREEEGSRLSKCYDTIQRLQEHQKRHGGKAMKTTKGKVESQTSGNDGNHVDGVSNTANNADTDDDAVRFTNLVVQENRALKQRIKMTQELMEKERLAYESLRAAADVSIPTRTTATGAGECGAGTTAYQQLRREYEELRLAFNNLQRENIGRKTA